MKSRYRTAGLLALVVLALDQITKIAVMQSMAFGASKTIIPGLFNLVHIVNRGAAFGFLNRADITWQRTFFIAATLLAIVVIVHLLRSNTSQEGFLTWGLGLILGGALGNLVDRIRFGHVVDFLDFHLGARHWPAFNVADIAITLGAFAVIVSMYRKRKHASHSS
ncbi:MAG: signal peptidase II [Desulfovibrionaceae bacterium]